jgi:dienelactone hydrolase
MFAAVPALPCMAPRHPLPRTLAEWERLRRATRRRLWALLGDLPPRPRLPTATLVRRRVERDYVREDLRLDNAAGAVVPAVLLRPTRGRAPHPVVIHHHAHGSDYATGLAELFRAGPAPVVPATDLTRRGYAVFAIDAYAFGARRGHGPGGREETGPVEETSLAKLFLWQGTSLWAMMVRDDLLALDYVASRDDLDPRRIGAMGMSMGSTRTWWLAALDDRIATAVCVACLTRYADLVRRRALRRHAIYYFVPGMLRAFDTEAIVSLVAPRPLLTLTGGRDPGSPREGVERVNRFCRAVYRLHGRPDAFAGVVYPRVGHAYTPPMWRRAVAWLDAHLSAAPGAPSRRRAAPAPAASGTRRAAGGSSPSDRTGSS